jgi:hypothetical protein
MEIMSTKGAARLFGLEFTNMLEGLVFESNPTCYNTIARNYDLEEE